MASFSRSGPLAFDTRDSDHEESEEEHVTTPIHAVGSIQYQVMVEDETLRDRSSSTSSQQIGRFEVRYT